MNKCIFFEPLEANCEEIWSTTSLEMNRWCDPWLAYKVTSVTSRQSLQYYSIFFSENCSFRGSETYHKCHARKIIRGLAVFYSACFSMHSTMQCTQFMQYALPLSPYADIFSKIWKWHLTSPRNKICSYSWMCMQLFRPFFFTLCQQSVCLRYHVGQWTSGKGTLWHWAGCLALSRVGQSILKILMIYKWNLVSRETLVC